jgi:hypothetical protein
MWGAVREHETIDAEMPVVGLVPKVPPIPPEGDP